MEPTTLEYLLSEEGITLFPGGLSAQIHPHWIVNGEDRLSYTTLVQLIECCREHHWATDILFITKGHLVDSITKSLVGEFVKLIPIGSVISITYVISNVRRRGYMLTFDVRDFVTQSLCAKFDLISVFYDPIKNEASAPPIAVYEYLLSKCSPEIDCQHAIIKK